MSSIGTGQAECNSGQYSSLLIWLLLTYVVLLHLGETVEFPGFNSRIQLADLWFILLVISWLWSGGLSALASLVKTRLFVVLPLAFTGSLIHSTDISKSLVAIAGMAYLILLYHIITQVIDSKKRVLALLSTWVGSSALLIVLSLGAAAAAFWNGAPAGAWLYHYDPAAFDFPRIKGTFHSPTMYLSVMHVTLVFGAILLSTRFAGMTRVALQVVMVLVVFSSFFTLSHGVASLWLTAFLITLWAGGGVGWPTGRYLLGFGFTVFLVVNVLSVVFRIYPVQLQVDPANQVLAMRVSYVPSIYMVQYRAAIDMGLEHPLLGHGIGTFALLASRYIDWDRTESTFASHSDATRGYYWRPSFDPHSTYLGAFAEGGLVGLSAVVSVFAVVLWQLIRFVSKSSRTFWQWCGWCVCAGHIGFLLHGVTVDMLLFRHFWVMLAVGGVAIRLAERPSVEG